MSYVLFVLITFNRHWSLTVSSYIRLWEDRHWIYSAEGNILIVETSKLSSGKPFIGSLAMPHWLGNCVAPSKATRLRGPWCADSQDSWRQGSERWRPQLLGPGYRDTRDSHWWNLQRWGSWDQRNLWNPQNVRWATRPTVICEAYGKL